MRDWAPDDRSVPVLTTSHKWTVLKIEDGQVSVWDIVPVLPTRRKWMNSQSSYHAIQRLATASGLHSCAAPRLIRSCNWGCHIGDGRKWDCFPGESIIHQNDGGGGLKGNYRPYFLGYLGRGQPANKYLLVWGESPAGQILPRITYGRLS